MIEESIRIQDFMKTLEFCSRYCIRKVNCKKGGGVRYYSQESYVKGKSLLRERNESEGRREGE